MRRRTGPASPSKKSVSKLRQKVDPWTEVRDRLNRILRGWSNYFGYGTRLMAYRAVDQYVYERVRSFLRRRHKVSSRGSTPFSDAVVFGKLGVLRLRDVHLGYRRPWVPLRLHRPARARRQQ
jgi:RNA-directed DNA polymerase